MKKTMFLIVVAALVVSACGMPTTGVSPAQSTAVPNSPAVTTPTKAAVVLPPASTTDRGKFYFFQDGEYLRYDVSTDQAEPGYPQAIDAAHWSGWPSTWTGVDATVNSSNNKKIYFFRGSEYLRYDRATNQVDPGYPKAIDDATWPGWPSTWTGLDATVNSGDNKAYFFRGGEYLRYDLAADQAEPGYPKAIDDTSWPGWPSTWTGVDAAVNSGNNKAYFFRGSEYLRYDLATNRVDPGYPKAIDDTSWPGWPSTWLKSMQRSRLMRRLFWLQGQILLPSHQQRLTGPAPTSTISSRLPVHYRRHNPQEMISLPSPTSSRVISNTLSNNTMDRKTSQTSYILAPTTIYFGPAA